MKFTLLTHEKEIKRADNSGQLLSPLSGITTDIIRWQRTHPEQPLCQALAGGTAVLVVPQGDGQKIEDLSAIEHFVILDGTWQEAGKIYNKSPYLKTAPWFALNASASSRYTLRRNQTAGGLCTVECAMAILRLKQYHPQAQQLEQRFNDFLQAQRGGLR